MTRKQLIQKLRKLIEPREYVVWLHDTFHMSITADWTSDDSLYVWCKEFESAKPKALKKAVSLSFVQRELAKWKKEIKNSIKASDELAKKDGAILEIFFEDLLQEADV